ncbi:MAG: hypothetical protein R6U32_04475 [Candidatus Woesearchaeota archaeon]
MARHPNLKILVLAAGLCCITSYANHLAGCADTQEDTRRQKAVVKEMKGRTHASGRMPDGREIDYRKEPHEGGIREIVRLHDGPSTYRIVDKDRDSIPEIVYMDGKAILEEKGSKIHCYTDGIENKHAEELLYDAADVFIMAKRRMGIHKGQDLESIAGE